MRPDTEILRRPYWRPTPSEWQDPPKIPESQNKVWRYMDLAKLVTMLDQGALYFPLLAALDDELEAAPPKQPPHAMERDRAKVWYLWNHVRNVVFVNCWHLADDESAAMWEIYAPANYGLAIRTTVGELTGSFHPSDIEGHEDLKSGTAVMAGSVEYIDASIELIAPDMYNVEDAALKKRSYYESEHEFRLLYRVDSNYPRLDFDAMFARPLPKPKKNGVWIEWNFKKAAKAIVIAPKAAPFVYDAVCAVCERFGVDTEIVCPSRIGEGVPVQPDWDRYREWEASLSATPARPT